jgi:hypothetical protein
VPTSNGRAADQIGRASNKQRGTDKSRPRPRTDEAAHKLSLVRWYPTTATQRRYDISNADA